MAGITKPQLPADFVERGKAAWENYQEAHDVSHLRGQVAAIDPDSGKVWIATDEVAVIDMMDADGFSSPVYLVRVGFDYLTIKGKPAIEQTLAHELAQDLVAYAEEHTWMTTDS